MGLSHLEFKRVQENLEEVLIPRFDIESINALLQEYVKVQDVLEDDLPEFQFQESGEEIPLDLEIEGKSSSCLESNDNDEMNELKDGSGYEEKEGMEEVTSSSMGDDKKSHEIMTLEQITQEWMTL